MQPNREDISHRLFNYVETVLARDGALVRCYRSGELSEELAAIVRFQRDLSKPFVDLPGSAETSGDGGLRRTLELWLPYDEFTNFVGMLALPGPFRLFINEPVGAWALVAGVSSSDGFGGEPTIRSQELNADISRKPPGS